MTIDASSDNYAMSDGSTGIALKVQSTSWELNVAFSPPEVHELLETELPSWLSGSLKVGVSAGQAVAWSCDDGRVSILVGHDDQSWDFGVFVSIDEFASILASLKEHITNQSTRLPGSSSR